MKKILIIAMIPFFVLSAILFTPVKEAYAIGVVTSNAAKSAVLGAMEQAGVKFGSKEAKEKAFDAWNQKAYERWKADEAAGRNETYWADYEGFFSGPGPKVEPIPDKPGFGRVLLDMSIYGMAIGIGADIGYAIEEAQENNRYMDYLSGDIKTFAGISYNDYLGLTTKKESTSDPSYPIKVTLLAPDGKQITSISSSQKDDPSIFVHVMSYKWSETGKYYTLTIQRVNWQTNNIKDFTYYPIDGQPVSNAEGIKYSLIPGVNDVPSINPAPYLEPLITPNTDLQTIPEVLPPDEKYPVIVPLDEPYWNGQINPEYIPTPVPEPEPEPEPEPNPGDEPGTEPGTEPEPNPDETPPKPPEEPITEEDFEDLSCAKPKKPNFEPIGDSFTNAFPFSLPWDIKRFIDAAFGGIDDNRPKFDLTFLGDGITLEIPKYFDNWMPFIKAFIVIVFDIGVLFLFYRFMKGGGE